MAASPRRHPFVDTNNQKVLAVVQMITHLKQAGPGRTEVFTVGGSSFVVQGAVDDLDAQIWP